MPPLNHAYMIKFDDLSPNQQAEFVWTHGIFLTSLEGNKIKYNHFSIEELYIEIKFDIASSKPLEISVITEQQVVKYLNSINKN